MSPIDETPRSWQSIGTGSDRIELTLLVAFSALHVILWAGGTYGDILLITGAAALSPAARIATGRPPRWLAGALYAASILLVAIVLIPPFWQS